MIFCVAGAEVGIGLLRTVVARFLDRIFLLHTVYHMPARRAGSLFDRCAHRACPGFDAVTPGCFDFAFFAHKVREPGDRISS